MFGKLIYAFVFLVAVISLSEFFNAHKYISAGEGLKATLVICGSLSLFLLSLTFMAYRIYADEKKAHNLKSNFIFFDWLYSVERKS
jgi:ABC-type transport system involved in multi-copper enzyme maturation permease subunit